MSVFLATFAVFAVCCLLLGAGMILDNRKLQGGCGHKPAGAPRCDNCPNAHKHGHEVGESQ
jgi:hypothetical protein